MVPLTESETSELNRLLRLGQPLPEHWRYRLFPSAHPTQETGKEYRLVYDGMLKREEVLAQTPAAPWQLVREFCTERPHADGWRNLLVWGDNLLALRELLADQQGPDRFGTRGKIKLIYIDPPFATRQDFMKDKEKAYRDKVLGAQVHRVPPPPAYPPSRNPCRRRQHLRPPRHEERALLKAPFKYLKAVLDEVFGEENFVNQIIWRRLSAHNDAVKYGPIHDMIFFYTKRESYVWNKQFAGVSPEYIKQFFDQVEAGNRTEICARRLNGARDSPWRDRKTLARAGSQ